ncbi:MAG: hypothetical protein K0Q58_1414 [Microbacterium sp.]|nr:hypothetical protein [Microbacterium sp.]
MSTRWSPSVFVTSVTVLPESSSRPCWVVTCLAAPRLDISEKPTIRNSPINKTYRRGLRVIFLKSIVRGRAPALSSSSRLQTVASG